jgi:hypothetical protein
MFCFGREEFNFKSKKLANYRIDDFRHNPYVGSFHAVPYKTEESSQADDSLLLMSESKTNPMVGLFRHSPPNLAPQQSQNQRVGLKSVIYDEQPPSSNPSLPIISRLRINTSMPRSTLTGRTFISSLRKIPVKVYCSSSRSSSVATRSVVDGHQPIPLETNVEDSNSKPMCAICLEDYADGDELLTLACSHCFHSECVNRWFYHGCISANQHPHSSSFSGASNPNGQSSFYEAFRCPACRQDHIALSEKGSTVSLSQLPVEAAASPAVAASPSIVEELVEDVEENDGGIPTGSFFELGQSLLRDGGYDFLSDVGSERGSVTSTAPGVQSPQPSPFRVSNSIQYSNLIKRSLIQRTLEESAYSDCGFPLPKTPQSSKTWHDNNSKAKFLL